MIKQLKAEVYKIAHSKVLLFFILMIFVLFMFNITGSLEFIAGGDRSKFGAGIGFYINNFNSESPEFWEIGRSMLGVNTFFWLAILPLYVVEYNREVNNRTIQLFSTYGKNVSVMLFTKQIVLFLINIIGYLLLSTAVFITQYIRYGVTMNHELLIEFMTLQILSFLVAFVYMQICSVLAVVIKNSAICLLLTIIIMFAGMITLPMVYTDPSKLSYQILRLHPIFYLSNLASGRTVDIFPYIYIYIIGGTLLAQFALQFFANKQILKSS